MPPAKSSTSRSLPAGPFKEPAALKWLSNSLDAAQQALVELRADAGRDLSHGARDLHKDLRTFISNARRDSGKLAKALQRDFAPSRRPSWPRAPNQRRPSDPRPGERPPPPPRARGKRRPRTTTRAVARPPRRRSPPQPARAPAPLRPVRALDATSSLPLSSISPGSLSLRRPHSSASRTPRDSTQPPAACQPTRKMMTQRRSA
jgi:hypothetical protein